MAWFLVKGIHIKHFRINVSDIKIEKCFDDSMSSNSKNMIELLIVYIVQVVKICKELKRY